MGVLTNYFTVFNEADIGEVEKIDTEVKITSKKIMFALYINARALPFNCDCSISELFCLVSECLE